MSGEVVTVFRSRLRPDAGDDYDRTAAEMEQRARAMSGFVDFKTFVAADGERLSFVVFASRAEHDAWRDDADHRVAQRRGRDEWYSWYAIQVCDVVAERTFTR
ncbi:MAG TPA: antibiotic biosynthesis monooxygenase [Acidimicrobiia bacterium]|nr:antibiotic biosynthesis monooxygenase [Acidimicrobiia bacterium]